MNGYPWYEIVAHTVPLQQGDIVESCPVIVFDHVPDLPNPPTEEALATAVEGAAGVQSVRVIVMTQACDIEQGKIRDVILCPIYHLQAWREQWEERRANEGKGSGQAAFDNHLDQVKKGQIWNLAMLNGRDADEAAQLLAMPVQVVDFHEIFSLPLEFMRRLVQAFPRPRFRLCPPYREHLSQAFARYFMRVGLPQDIQLPKA